MKRPKRNSGISPRLMEAASNGDARSQYKVGSIYYEGWVVPKDDRLAESWWRKAAEAGNAAAQFALGAPGLDIRIDEAVSWVKRSAENDNPTAQVFLAKLYFWGGGGVKRDSVEALKLLALAYNTLPKFCIKINYRFYRMLSRSSDILAANELAREWRRQHPLKAYDAWS